MIQEKMVKESDGEEEEDEDDEDDDDKLPHHSNHLSSISTFYHI